MKYIKSLLTVPAVLILVGAVGVPTAAAEHGNSDNTAGRSIAATQSQTDNTNVPPPTDDQNSGGSGQEVEQANEHRANVLVQNLQAKRHNKQDETTRTRKCEAAKQGLERKLTNLQKNAAKHKALIDKVYSQALSYQQQNNLNPTGFADLVNTANTDQAKATASVSALNNLSVNLDCNSATVATNVANFKTAAQQARDDLLTYRNSVKAVLRALQTAKQQGGQQ